jgi:hypothetical protein
VPNKIPFVGLAALLLQLLGAGETAAVAQDARPIVIVPPTLLDQINDKSRDRAGWNDRAPIPLKAKPEGRIRVDRLGGLENSAVGLEAGYGPEIWRGSRAAYTIPQLDRLPVVSPIRILKQMEVSLLRGQAYGPVGEIEQKTWFAARLNRLLDLGNTQSVVDLMQVTGAIGRDPGAAQTAISAYLLSGDLVRACEMRATAVLPEESLFATEYGVLCDLHAGNRSAAALAIDLHAEQFEADPFFRELAYLFAIDAPAFGVTPPAHISPTQFALMILTDFTLPNDRAIYAAASYPFLASNPAIASTLRLQAAAQSVEDLLMPFGFFQITAEQVALSTGTAALATETAPETAAADQPLGAAVSGLSDLVTQWQETRTTGLSADQAEQFLLAAYRLGHWSLAVRLIESDILALDDRGNEILALAALDIGRPDKATAFIAGLPVSAAVQPTHHQIHDVVGFWQGDGRTMLPQNQTTDLLAAAPTFLEVLAQAIYQPMQALDSFAASSPRISRARSLVSEARLGDLVLHIQAGLDGRSWQAWSTVDAVLAVAPLAALGLSYEAEAAAREIIVQVALVSKVQNQGQGGQ